MALWDLTDRSHPTHRADLPGHDPDSAIGFSPDGRMVAVATGRTVNLWNLVDGSDPVLRGTLKGHFDSVSALAFSPDGQTLATGSADKTAALWNVADPSRPRRLAILAGNGSGVWSVAFAPGGEGLSATSALLWDYSALNDLRADPADLACAVTGGDLTPDEWATYIPEVPYQPTCPQ